MRAPIAVFAYKRAAMLGSTLAQLAANEQASTSDLFIYCDGGKKPEDADKIDATRAVARACAGFKSVSVIERDSNLGLARSIRTGVTELCNRFGRVIVVEDDFDLSPDFLGFMNAALERYKDEPSVMQVSGHMWDVPLGVTDDALFLSFTTSWGWATWQRAWEHYTEDLTDFDQADADWLKRFDLDGNFAYKRMLDRARKAEVDSWAIYWYYSVFESSGLTVYPRQSMVAHRGFEDEDRTHGHGRIPWATKTGHFPAIPRWPEVVRAHEAQSTLFKALRQPGGSPGFPARLQALTTRVKTALGLKS